MPLGECFTLMGIGGLFIILGLAAIIWGRKEEKGYYNAISSRLDVREYIEHSPRRPEPGALRIGGWIAIILGLIMLGMGSAFWLLD